MTVRTLLVCSRPPTVLVRLELLKCWKETTTCKYYFQGYKNRDSGRWLQDCLRIHRCAWFDCGCKFCISLRSFGRSSHSFYVVSFASGSHLFGAWVACGVHVNLMSSSLWTTWRSWRTMSYSVVWILVQSLRNTCWQLLNAQWPENFMDIGVANQTTSTGTVISTFVCTVQALDSRRTSSRNVAAHLRGFEEDSRSEVVLWIDEWSIEFGYHWFDVAHVHDHSPLPIPLRSFWAVLVDHFDVLQACCSRKNDVYLCGNSWRPFQVWTPTLLACKVQSRVLSPALLLTFTTTHLLMRDQLFGVGALAHRGLSPLQGLVRGSFPAPHHHDPNKMLPNFAFWVMVGCSTCPPCTSRFWRSCFEEL